MDLEAALALCAGVARAARDRKFVIVEETGEVGRCKLLAW